MKHLLSDTHGSHRVHQLGWALGTVLVAGGFLIGARQLSDNSFFTHLATGNLIVNTRSIPTSDPFTFHSHGTAWVVQSWLVSLVYGLLNGIFGLVGIRMFHAVLSAVAALGIWRLTSGARSLIPRVAIAALTFTICAPTIVERPLMVGLLCFIAVLLLNDEGPPWLILPVMWIWVNSHGSYPLGLLFIVAVIIGRVLDKDWSARSNQLLILATIGVAIGGVVTPRPGVLLWFPFHLLGRNGAFQYVTEWRSPDFADLWMKVFLLQVLLVIAALSRRESTHWQTILPTMLLLLAALLGLRNVSLAALTFTPVLASEIPVIGQLRSSTRSKLALPVIGIACITIVGSICYVVSSNNLNLSAYPVAEIEYLEASGLLPNPDVRVAYREMVGNYLDYRYGPVKTVFFDDRFDMYSAELLGQLFDISTGHRVVFVLDSFKIDYVIWHADGVVAELLNASPDWDLVEVPAFYHDQALNNNGADVATEKSQWQLFERKHL